MLRVTSTLMLFFVVSPARADVGDPQLKTDHPWYPGELACSTWERLFATQAKTYTRVTGRDCTTDEDKALAAWLWRNTHYWHGEEGVENLWGQGFGKGLDPRGREYWTGLFAHGYGLCGTTHCQWVAEMEARFGHGRGRAVGANGHSAFEVFLIGDAYGVGQWVLLDHDLSTVVFDPTGRRLLGMKEIAPDWKKLTDRGFKPERQCGWLICGLHPADNASYSRNQVAEYLAGYAGPPPMVHLRRGETFRRILNAGLDDGKTFWGSNYNTDGITGAVAHLDESSRGDVRLEDWRGLLVQEDMCKECGWSGVSVDQGSFEQDISVSGVVGSESSLIGRAFDWKRGYSFV